MHGPITIVGACRRRVYDCIASAAHMPLTPCHSWGHIEPTTPPYGTHVGTEMGLAAYSPPQFIANGHTTRYKKDTTTPPF